MSGVMGSAGEHGDAGEAAGRLLRCALTPRQRPGRDPEYAELLRRYRQDAAFRHLVDGVARGLGLIVLDAGDHGMVLGSSEDSPFALGLRDYRRNLTVEERVCHGLIQLAIAAWCFPTASELDDPHGSVKRVSAGKLVKYLVALSEELKRRAPVDATPELQEAWRAVLNRAETRTTPDERRAAGTLQGMAEYALEVLAGSGLLRRVNDEEGGTYQTLAGYRVQVRDLAAQPAFALVQAAGRGASACPAS